MRWIDRQLTIASADDPGLRGVLARFDLLTTSPDELLRSGEMPKLDPKLVASRAPLFLGTNIEDTRRKQPRILPPVEYKAAVTLARIPVYLFDNTGERILVLEGFRPQPGMNEGGAFLRPGQAQNAFNRIGQQIGGLQHPGRRRPGRVILLSLSGRGAPCPTFKTAKPFRCAARPPSPMC